MKIWKIFGLFILQKNEKVCSGENTKEVYAQKFDKDIMDKITYLIRHFTSNQEYRWAYTQTKKKTLPV